MSAIKRIMNHCKTNGLNCSITYQKINDFSIEIYTGYRTNYKKIYYTDGHESAKKAAKAGLFYVNQHYLIAKMQKHV